MRTITKRFFRMLSARGPDTKKNYKVERQVQNFLHQHVLRPTERIFDEVLRAPGRDILLRVFYPAKNSQSFSVLLFFHGGGWVTGSLDSYDKMCTQLADKTDHIVISVGYRLAPEHKFPAAVEDCYYATQHFLRHANQYGINHGRISLAGDSAGGNIAAAVCLMARDRDEPMPCKQVLIYPATDSLRPGVESPYLSMKENGTDYILTRQRIQDYMDMYHSGDEDWDNPYFAPIKAESLRDQPDTLVIVAEFDPLRDEGEAYAQRLAQADNFAVCHCARDALHGYLTSGLFHKQVEESYDWISVFLSDELKESVV